jgi:hypothetical protein
MSTKKTKAPAKVEIPAIKPRAPIKPVKPPKVEAAKKAPIKAPVKAPAKPVPAKTAPAPSSSVAKKAIESAQKSIAAAKAEIKSPAKAPAKAAPTPKATAKPPRPSKTSLIVPIFPAVTGLGILKIKEIASEFNNRLELLLRSLPLQLAVHYRQRATPFIGSDLHKPMTGVYVGFMSSQSIPAPAFIYYSAQLDRWSYSHDTWDGILSAMNGGNDAPGLRPNTKKAIPDIFYWSGFNHDPMDV